MKTKFKSLFTILFFCISGSLFGQGLFVRVSPALAIAASGDDIGSVVIADTANPTETVVYGSEGVGFVAGLDLGYMVTENLGFQLGFEYQAGARREITRIEVSNATQMGFSQSNQLRLSPEVIVSGGSGTLAPYGRFGLSIPLATTTTSEVEVVPNTGSTDFYSSTEFKSGTSLGFRGAIGVNWALGDKLSIFGELAGLSQRVRTSSSTVTEWESAGTSLLDQLSIFQIEKNYVETIDNNSNNSTFNMNVDDNQPEDLNTFSINFTSILLKVGVAFQF